MKKTVKKKAASPGRARLHSNHALVGTWEDPDKKIWIPVRYKHPLVGTWQEVEDSVGESSVIYKISVVDGHFVVSGIEEDTGTRLKISNVLWDGAALKFTSLFPPTGHRVKHALRLHRPGLVEHEMTYTDRELWRKRQHKPARTSHTPTR